MVQRLVTTAFRTRNQRLKAARLAAMLSQEGLSAVSGVSRATVGNAERYGYVPRLRTRMRIAAALQLTVEDLWPTAAPEAVAAEAEATDDTIRLC